MWDGWEREGCVGRVNGVGGRRWDGVTAEKRGRGKGGEGSSGTGLGIGDGGEEGRGVVGGHKGEMR